MIMVYITFGCPRDSSMASSPALEKLVSAPFMIMGNAPAWVKRKMLSMKSSTSWPSSSRKYSAITGYFTYCLGHT
jgi:hypothetical protein